MPETASTRPPPPALDVAAPGLGIALFLDVDGALLPFASAPDNVSVPAPLVARLTALHAALHGALALVSGRRIADLDALFAPLVLPCAGLHGLERRHGDVVERVAHPPDALDAVRAAAQAIAAKYPGSVVEDKGIALALHWRGEPLAAADFQGLAATAAMALPDHRLQHGDQVVELRPVGADKGTAIAAFLREAPFAGRRPVFAGDDLTDEHGFETVNLHGGISVLVGAREPSAARYALRDVPAVHAWLGVERAA